MKHLLTAAFTIVASVGLAGGAFAQNTVTPGNPHPSTPAVTTSNENNAGAPARGANSFTEAQAKSRIEAAGYSDVSALTKDKDGIWRGQAAKGDTKVTVSLDYQGNVVAN